MITSAYSLSSRHLNAPVTFPNGWLAFELGVLRRLKFASVALPFTGEPELGIELKRWKVRVAANDPMLWSYTKATALVENPNERLDEFDIATIVDDAYMPREKLDNPSLLNCLKKRAAWFFNIVGLKAGGVDTPNRGARPLPAVKK